MATAANRRRRDRNPTASRARRILVGFVRWTAVGVLWLVYYTVCGMCLLFALILGFNQMPVGVTVDTGWRVFGTIALATAGVLTFIYFPRVVRKLTDREVLTPRSYGGYSGGGGDG